MLNRTDTLDFYSFGDVKFQSLVDQLLAKEPYSLQSIEYGARGFKQYGIDSNAHRFLGGHTAAQAKCYQDFDLADLNKTYKDFKDHIEKWKEKDLRLFIIAVSCKVKDPKVNDHIMEISNELFKQHGMHFVLWDAKTITDKMRPHRHIARQYMENDGVVDLLCGPDPEVRARYLMFLHQERVASSGDAALNWVDESTDQELKSVRQFLRRGQGLQALNTLEHLLTLPTWEARSAKSQARILRFTASLYLSTTGNDAQARSAAITASTIDPSEDDLVLEVEFDQFYGRTEQALEKTRHAEHPRLRLIAASLLLSQQPEASLALLDSIQDPHLESTRTRLTALALALNGNLEEAQRRLQQRLEQEPEHYLLQLTLASLHYFTALSPALRRAGRLGSPLPITPSLLQLNSSGLRHLRQVQILTEQLLARQDIDPHLRQEAALLRVAALANDPDHQRQTEAEQLVQKQLENKMATPELVMWALFFQWALDLTPHLSWLLDDPSPNGVLAVLQWHLELKANDAAQQVFDFHADRLKTADPHVFQTWKQMLARAGDTAMQKLTQRLQRANQATDAESQLQAFLAGQGELNDTIAVLQEAGGQVLVTHADPLIERLQTPGAVFVCIAAAFEQGEYDVILRLKSTYQDLLDGAVIPRMVRHALMVASTMTGRLPQALADARILVEEQPSAFHMLHLIHLSVMAARTTEIPSLLRHLLTAPDLTLQQALAAAGYAGALREKRLNASLARRAQELVQDDENLETIALAMLMGRIPEDRQVMEQFQILVAEGRAKHVRQYALEDVAELLGQPDHRTPLYERGAVGVHLLWEHDIAAFARTLFQNHGHPVYTHFGGLESRWLTEDDSAKVSKTLRIDLTTLLFLSHLDLLDIIADHFHFIVAGAHVQQLTTLLADPTAQPFHIMAQELQIWIRNLEEEGKLSFTATVFNPERNLGPQLHGFANLLLTCPPDQHLCVDDRWAQLATLKAGRAVLSTVSLLDELQNKGALSNERHAQLRQQLRRENRQFIPINDEEILYWAQQAPIRAGRVVETSDLILLRQYYAACLSSDSHLMPVTVENQRIGEGDLPFVLQYMHEARSAVKLTFRDLDDPQPVAQWIFESLFFDTAAFSELKWAAHPLGRSNDLREFELIGLALSGASLPAKAQAAYYQWVYRTLMQPRFAHDPELQQRFAQVWKKHIRELIEHAEDDLYRGAVVMSAMSAETHLPELKAAVFDDVDYLKATGRSPIHILSVADERFNLLHLWKLFPRLYAQSDQEQALNSETGVRWLWRVVPDGEQFLLRATGPDDQKYYLPIGEMWLSLNRRADREQHRDEILSTLPGINPDDPRVERLFRHGALANRMNAYLELQHSSAGTFYRMLKQQLRVTPVTLHTDRSTWMPGNPEHLLIAVGLHDLMTSSNPDVSGLMTRHAEQGDVLMAAMRLSGLPVAWPDPLVRAVLEDGRSEEEKQRLIGAGGSVLTLAYLVRALRASQQPNHVRWRQRLAQLLVSESAVAAMEALLASVEWSFERLHLQVPHWPPAAHLAAAWLHGHELYSSLSLGGYRADEITRIFNDDRSFLPMGARLHTRQQELDVANPLAITARRAVLALFAYAADDLTQVCASSLRRCLIERGNEHRQEQFVRHELLGSDVPRPNHLDSVFSVQLATIFRQLDVLGTELLDATAFELNSEASLGDVNTRPNFHPQLLSFVGRSAARHRAGLKAEHHSKLLNFDVQQWDAEYVIPGLLGAARLTALDASDVLEAQILSELARYLETGSHTPDTAAHVYEIVMELARHPRHVVPHRWLAEQLDTLVRPHDGLRRTLFYVVFRYATEGPAHEAAPFWPVLLNWRRLNSALGAPDHDGEDEVAAVSSGEDMVPS